LLEVPPLVNHIICCIYHAVKLDFFAVESNSKYKISKSV